MHSSSLRTLTLLGVLPLVAGGCASEPITPEPEAPLAYDSSAATTSFTLWMAPPPLGNDANPGSQTQPIATLDRAEEILHEARPGVNASIRIFPGEYHCAGATDWTFYEPGRWTIIEAADLGAVPSPAKDSADDPDRPVFIGRDLDGGPCANSKNWFTFTHGNEAANLVLRGLKATYYRNGMLTQNTEYGLSDAKQNIIIDNMVFERLGETFYPEYGVVRGGALSWSQSRGNQISNSYFRWIKNSTENGRGLIHALYFRNNCSDNNIYNNHFHSLSGSAIKLTNYSNNNRIIDNGFSYIYATYALVDRWCGALLPGADTQCAAAPECPSWDNYFPLERNKFSHLDGARGKVYSIPPPPVLACEYPARNLRMDLGTGGKVYGASSATF